MGLDFEEFFDFWAQDPGNGLSEAVNVGLQHMPGQIEFVSWLGDDDVLSPSSLECTVKALRDNDRAVVAFGDAQYIDDTGKVFWTNHTGKWAVKLMRFGPNRIPQPGSLIRKSAMTDIGGLDSNLKWAMDLDMFIKLSKIGEFVYLKEVLAKYRWHSSSLSSSFAEKSLRESSAVRLAHVPSPLKWAASVLEFLHVKLALAGTSRLDKMSKS